MFDSQKKWQVVLLCHSLRCGGAERAMVLLAQGLSDRSHQVTFITIDNDAQDFYTLNPQVKRIYLDVASNSSNLIEATINNSKRLMHLRNTIKDIDPDIIISCMDITNILTLLALAMSKYKIIVNEQNNPLSLHSKTWQILRYLTYPSAAKLVSVSQGVDREFGWLAKSKKTVIYNSLTPPANRPTAVALPPGADADKKWLVAMGRLVQQKNFSMLLSAFQRIADKHPDWQLLIFGEGELRSQLEAQRDKLCLGDRVLLPGITTNPFAIYERAELYVMSSLWEGLGVVLIEALACGLPVVSTDCPSGPREVVRDGIDGILVPNGDETALAEAMDLLMSDESKRKELSARAREAEERFSLAKITSEWERLIAELI